MQQWVGHSAQELIAKLGPPSAILRNSGSGRMIVYDDHSQMTVPGSRENKPSERTVEEKASSEHVPTYLSEKPVNGPQVYIYARRRVFYVDRHGIIYRCESRQGAAPVVQR